MKFVDEVFPLLTIKELKKYNWERFFFSKFYLKIALTYSNPTYWRTFIITGIVKCHIIFNMFMMVFDFF